MNSQFSTGKNKPSTTFTSSRPTPVEPQPSNYWDSMMNLFRRIYESKPDLKKCKKYSKYNEEAKNMLVKTSDIQPGVSIYQYGVLSQSAVHQCAFSHTLSLGLDTGMGDTTNQYGFMVNYQTTNGGIVTRVDSNQVLDGTLKQKFLNRNLHSKTKYDTFRKNMNSNAIYYGSDWAADARLYKSGTLMLSFMQRITPSLCLGVSTIYDGETRGTNFAGAIRYQPDKTTVIAAELLDKPDGNKMLKASYVKAVDYSLDMVAELRYDFKDRKAAYKYGFEQEFLNSQYKCTIHQDNRFEGVFEHKISNVTMTFNVQVDPTKKKEPQGIMAMMTQSNPVALPDVKFGMRIIIEPGMIAE